MSVQELTFKLDGHTEKQGIGQDDFDALLVSEVETLREGEKHLNIIYQRMREEPQLREFFLQELAEVQQRATRLLAVLCPDEILESAFWTSPTMRPAA